MKRNLAFSFEIEIERNGQSVEYEVRCELSPYDPGRASGPPENCYPPEGGEIEVKEVWYNHSVRCPECRGSGLAPKRPEWTSEVPENCHKCKGKGRIYTSERREELDELVDDDECMAHVPEPDEEPDYDEPDYPDDD